MMVIVVSACLAQRLRCGAGEGAATALATFAANAAETPAAVARSMNSRRLMKPWRRSTMASSRKRFRSAIVSLRSLIAGKLLPERHYAPPEPARAIRDPAAESNPQVGRRLAARRHPLACGAIDGWVAPLTMHSRCESMITSGACQTARRRRRSVPAQGGRKDECDTLDGELQRPLSGGSRHWRHVYRPGCLRHAFGGALDLENAVGAEPARPGAARRGASRGSRHGRHRGARPRHDRCHQRLDRTHRCPRVAAGHGRARGYSIHPAYQPEDAL